MVRRALVLVCLASIVAVGAGGAVGGCGSDNEAEGTGTDGGDEGFGSSGFVPLDSGGDGGTGGPNNCIPPTSLKVLPADTTASVAPGGTFTQAYTVVATYSGKPDQDVTGQSFFTTSDPGAGTFAGSTFTWGGTQGGALTVSALNCGVVGTTKLTLKATTAFGIGPDGGTVSDAGTAPTMFDTAPASTSAACQPNLVYPPEGVLIPPNMNVVEVHFTDGTPANNLFEVSFKNSITDIRVFTACNGTKASQGTQIGGGCVFELDQTLWNYVAKTNRDGDPVVVKVRGLGCDGGGGVASSNVRNVSFARDDMRGTLYYWASMRIDASGNAGVGFNSGGVFRYDFGVRGQSATPVLTPSSSVNSAQHNCIGCHSVSRDGRQMVFDFDDNDSDDEYGDVFTDVYDIAANTVVRPVLKNGANNFPPGFHTWNRSTTEFLLSDGPGNSATPNGAFARVSPAGVNKGFAMPGAVRGTTPDWAPDDSRVVFAVPPNVFASTAIAGYWMKAQGPRDDLMFAGASLTVAPWNDATKALGAPVTLLASNGTENFYYPSFSPEGSLIVYNHAASGPNFHNPAARIEVISASAATPTRADMAKLNDTGNLTNSWARWAPFVQVYKGKKLLWVTTSSTRNYGLRVDNTGQVNCYPKESPAFAGPVFTTAPNCTRTQLWMAAIDLDAAAVQTGKDVSYPAFYLPFQDSTTNNHLAQWAQKSFTGTCTTNVDCSAQPGKCCDNGGCTTCPSSPPATCATNANCATGQCCNGGACGACAGGADGGPGGPTTCSTCLDCSGQACLEGACGSCTNSSQCCAPLSCIGGTCKNVVN